MKEEFEQTVYLGGKLCNKVSKEIICSCFCEVKFGRRNLRNSPPFWKSSHTHTHIYIRIYIHNVYIDICISTIIHHPMGAYDCLWFSAGRVCGHFLCTACAAELSSQSTNPRCPVCPSTVSTPSTTTTRPQGGATWVNKRVGNGWTRNEMSIYIWKIEGIFPNWDDVWLGGWFAWKPGITKT